MPSSSDGYRILVDRLWPRGIKKEDLKMDYWAKDIAPSTALREWYHEDMTGRRTEFGKRYTKELDENPASRDFIRLAGEQPEVTLLYASKDPHGNQAGIIKDYLESNI